MPRAGIPCLNRVERKTGSIERLNPLRAHRAMNSILDYHDRTKHHPGRFARGPQGLDWANQPDPFRRFLGAPLTPLPLLKAELTVAAGVLFGQGQTEPQPLTLATLGAFLELALGLSARKETAASSWYLRMNPSSGNLHPTEAYAILPSLARLEGGGGVYHYAPRAHALEQRARWPFTPPAPPDTFWIGLASVTWREAWKYGERAFRYCQHDIGHALGALRFAAAVLGWRVQWPAQPDDLTLAHLLGLDRGGDYGEAEPETPELLVQIGRPGTPPALPPLTPGPSVAWFGRANRLSPNRVAWPVIDEAVAATRRTRPCPRPGGLPSGPSRPPAQPPPARVAASQLIRQRRSAVAFDGVTALPLDRWLAILDTTLPRPQLPPFDVWPYRPRVHLVLFAHRVTGLAPGLYLWLRHPADEPSLRRALTHCPEWRAVPHVPSPMPLWALGEADLREFARDLSCHQDIAADSAFSLGMLARFEPVLREHGAAAYRELFWEAGLIGQALYLAAEAAGLRGTGIGCYYDDTLHRALGLHGHEWQSLYHFTIGGPVEDRRLRTRPPYEDRDSSLPP